MENHLVGGGVCQGAEEHQQWPFLESEWVAFSLNTIVRFQFARPLLTECPRQRNPKHLVRDTYRVTQRFNTPVGSGHVCGKQPQMSASSSL